MTEHFSWSEMRSCIAKMPKITKEEAASKRMLQLQYERLQIAKNESQAFLGDGMSVSDAFQFLCAVQNLNLL